VKQRLESIARFALQATSLFLLSLGVTMIFLGFAGFLGGCDAVERNAPPVEDGGELPETYLCDLVNDGRRFRYDTERERFDVAWDVSEAVAADPEGALYCGAYLTEDWEVAAVRGGWLDFFHTDPGDVLLSVNDEADPAAMLAEVRRAADQGLEMTVQLERDGAEYSERVAWWRLEE